MILNAEGCFLFGAVISILRSSSLKDRSLSLNDRSVALNDRSVAANEEGILIFQEIKSLQRKFASECENVIAPRDGTDIRFLTSGYSGYGIRAVGIRYVGTDAV